MVHTLWRRLVSAPLIWAEKDAALSGDAATGWWAFKSIGLRARPRYPPAVDQLHPPDTFHLSAALGWLQLGNRAEAQADWNRLTPAARQHPDALEVQWAIHADAKNWTAALEAAQALLAAAPDRASGWLHRAYALRRVPGGGLQAAWDALHPAHEKFPDEPTIPYNLACYACQLGRLDDARQWLQRAREITGPETIRQMALNDADLETLWEEIRRW
jgi:tetratricopeptide (TPR) repeat protein